MGVLLVQVLKKYSSLKKKDRAYIARLLILGASGILLILALLIWLITLLFSPKTRVSPECSVNIGGDTYYYSQQSETLYRSNSGLSGNKLCECTDFSCITKYKNTLYVCANCGNKKGIYTVNAKTGVSELIIRGDCTDLYIKEDVMIYLCDGSVYMAESSGKFRRPVAGENVTALTFDGETVYYSDSSGLCSFDIKTLSVKKLNEKVSAEYISIWDNNLIYYNQNSRAIEKCSVSGGSSVTVKYAECDGLWCNFKAKRIIYSSGGALYSINTNGKKCECISSEYASPAHINGKTVYGFSKSGSVIKEKIK